MPTCTALINTVEEGVVSIKIPAFLGLIFPEIKNIAKEESKIERIIKEIFKALFIVKKF